MADQPKRGRGRPRTREEKREGHDVMLRLTPGLHEKLAAVAKLAGKTKAEVAFLIVEASLNSGKFDHLTPEALSRIE